MAYQRVATLKISHNLQNFLKWWKICGQCNGSISKFGGTPPHLSISSQGPCCAAEVATRPQWHDSIGAAVLTDGRRVFSLRRIFLIVLIFGGVIKESLGITSDLWGSKRVVLLKFMRHGRTSSSNICRGQSPGESWVTIYLPLVKHMVDLRSHRVTFIPRVADRLVKFSQGSPAKINDGTQAGLWHTNELPPSK